MYRPFRTRSCIWPLRWPTGLAGLVLFGMRWGLLGVQGRAYTSPSRTAKLTAPATLFTCSFW
jgi:hypothetical protein